MAFEFLRHPALRSNGTAQYLLGLMYEHGFGVPVDDFKALLYFQFGKLGGSFDSEMVMAHRHAMGLGAAKDCRKALKSYEILARNSAVWVQAQGIVAEERRLISDDSWQENVDEMANMVEYQELLAADGNPQAATVVGDLHMHGAHGVARDYNVARNHFELAVAQNEPRAFGEGKQPFFFFFFFSSFVFFDLILLIGP